MDNNRYLYISLGENTVWRARRCDEGVYCAESWSDAITIDLNDEANRNEIWEPCRYGKTARLTDKDGDGDWECFTDPRDAF